MSRMPLGNGKRNAIEEHGDEGGRCPEAELQRPAGRQVTMDQEFRLHPGDSGSHGECEGGLWSQLCFGITSLAVL